MIFGIFLGDVDNLPEQNLDDLKSQCEHAAGENLVHVLAYESVLMNPTIVTLMEKGDAATKK